NSYLRSQRRLVAVAGVDSVAVIETGDAILVAGLDAHQSIRDLVAILQKQDRAEAKAHLTSQYSWGSRECLKADPGYTLQELILKPDASLRVPDEWWAAQTQLTVVSGQASILVDDQPHTLAVGGSLTIRPAQSVTITSTAKPVTLLALVIAP
ncbi:MAG: hypothetical protein ACTSX7_10035, partial [Alphaproteobacteria bacterium]